MKKLITSLLILVLLLGMFVGGAMFLLSRLVQPEVFKERLVEAVALKTGRQLTIQGSIGVTIFPRFGAILRDVYLSNAPYFANQTFAHAGRIEVQVEVLPLFVGKVKIDKFIFKDVNLFLERKKSGDDNWNDLFNYKASESATSSQNQDLPELYLAKITFENAFVDFNDNFTQKHVEISNLNLDSQGINFNGNVFHVHAMGHAINDAPQLAMNFNCDSDVVLDSENKLYASKGLVFAGNVNSELLRQYINFSFGANVGVDINKQEIAIEKLRIQLANMIVTGQMHANNIIYAPEVIGDINIDSFDPKPLLRTFGLLQNEQKKIAKTASTQPSIWQNMSLKATVQTTSKFLKIPKLELHFNDSALYGSANYSHFADKLVVFNFDVDHLNLDRYQGFAAALSQQNVATKDVDAASALAKYETSSKRELLKGIGKKYEVAKGAEIAANGIDKLKSQLELLPILRQIVLNGDLHISDLQLHGMHFEQLNMQVSGDNDEININPFDCKFYDGAINGSLDIDIKKSIPVFGLIANIKNIAAQSLLKDVFGSDKLSGIADLKIKLVSIGDSADLLLKNLSGSSSLRIVKGVFYGIDIRYQIEKVRALINGTAASFKEEQPSRTTFSQLSGNFKITNGVANTPDLLLQSPDFQVKGAGSANLVAQNLDMQFDASYAEHNDFYVPIKVTGAFSSPNIKPDVAVFVGRLLKDAISSKGGWQNHGGKAGSKHGKDFNDGKIDAAGIAKALKIDDKQLRSLLSQ